MRSEVEQEIRSLIQEHGRITFAQFMQTCLYSPRGGFYSARGDRISAHFRTSATMHPVFGALIARQLEQMWQILGEPSVFHVVEVGSGDGVLARSITDACQLMEPAFAHAVRYVAADYTPGRSDSPGETLGWVGRFADAYSAPGTRNAIVNIGSSQSLAVRGKLHPPLVFAEPAQLRRTGSETEKRSISAFDLKAESQNPTLAFLRSVARNAADSGALVRDAWSSYRTPVDYGIAGGLSSDLRKVAALIAAGLPTQVYYVAYRGNSFDTHVHQADLHTRLLMYTADAIRGFMLDMGRIGRSADVSMMVFTEFGRRIEENASEGTDHGTAGPMFLVGESVKGGFYGATPSLTDTDAGNLKMTTDFRRVYATMIGEWMGHADTRSILKGEFEPLGAFA